MESWIAQLEGSSIVVLGIVASSVAGMATGIGALPVLFTARIGRRLQNGMLGFGAGVMLAATSFSLIVPGVEAAMAGSGGGSAALAALIVSAGMGLGGSFLHVCDRLSPHEHFITGPEGANPEALRRIWLFIIAITLHNFPEGLAVGVGFGGGDVANGVALATGIGLQNLPEGLVVAVALVSERYGKGRALAIATLTGLVEPVGGLIGAGIVSLVRPLLPWAMGFAAGAMLWVISDEIIPESHSGGREAVATVGVLVGFIIMMFLDVTLG